MIPGPDRALQVAKRRTASSAVGAIQLVPTSPVVFAALAVLLIFLAIRYPLPGLLPAVPGVPVLLAAAIRAECSSLLVRTADGAFEVARQNAVTRKVTGRSVDRSEISLLPAPPLGFRTIIVEERPYQVRPNSDPELRELGPDDG